jgi:hypothetical protein
MGNKPIEPKPDDAKRSVSRRAFLRSAGVAAAAAGAGVAGIASGAAAAETGAKGALTAEELAIKVARERLRIPPSPLDKIHLSHFAERIGAALSVRTEPSGTVKLTCVSAVDLNTRAVRGLDNFVVTFRGPSDVPLPDGIYAFSDGSLHDFDLHIAPHGSDDIGLLYQAVFCRFTP